MMPEIMKNFEKSRDDVFREVVQRSINDGSVSSTCSLPATVTVTKRSFTLEEPKDSVCWKAINWILFGALKRRRIKRLSALQKRVAQKAMQRLEDQLFSAVGFKRETQAENPPDKD